MTSINKYKLSYPITNFRKKKESITFSTFSSHYYYYNYRYYDILLTTNTRLFYRFTCSMHNFILMQKLLFIVSFYCWGSRNRWANAYYARSIANMQTTIDHDDFTFSYNQRRNDRIVRYNHKRLIVLYYLLSIWSESAKINVYLQFDLLIYAIDSVNW